jgi:hypothetical protein
VAATDTTDSTLAGDTAITGLSLSVQPNQRYGFVCYIVTSAAAATTGVQLGVTGPASPAAVSTSTLVYTAANTLSTVSINGYGTNPTAASNGTTRSMNRLATLFVNGANAGTFQLTVNTEVDTSQVTVHAGSWCEARTF